jgi:hypothetical protein
LSAGRHQTEYAHYWIRVIKKSAKPVSLIDKEKISDQFIKIPTVSTSLPENDQKAEVSIGCVKMSIPTSNVAALLMSLHQAIEEQWQPEE